MRIFILGACARMARPILPLLGAEPDVTEVILADRDFAAAQALATKLGEKYRAQGIDATDSAALVAAFRGAQAVAGFVGPFYRFEKPIAEAAIEAGVPYASIADDFDAYLQVETLHEAAQRKGVTILSGIGNSPGLTNLLAAKGYRDMDTPRRIHVYWTGGSDEEVGPANVLHVMHIFEGYTLQWRDGREARLRCGSDERVVDFPQPIGRHPTFITGHAESVSIPRWLKGLEEVTLHGGICPVWPARLAIALGRLGLTTTPERRRFMLKLLWPILDVFKMGGSADKSVFRVETHGTHQGTPRVSTYMGVGPIAEITAFPLLEATLLLARREVSTAGVFAPEGLLDPDMFLPRVARRGVTLLKADGTPLYGG